MIYIANITTPANTAQSSLKKTVLHVTKGLVYKVEFYFPSGSQGLMGVAVFDGLYQVWPSSVGEFFKGERQVIAFDDLYLKVSAPFEFACYTYNTDQTYEHMVSVRIGLVSSELFMGRFLPTMVTRLLPRHPFKWLLSKQERKRMEQAESECQKQLKTLKAELAAKEKTLAAEKAAKVKAIAEAETKAEAEAESEYQAKLKTLKAELEARERDLTETKAALTRSIAEAEAKAKAAAESEYQKQLKTLKAELEARERDLTETKAALTRSRAQAEAKAEAEAEKRVEEVLSKFRAEAEAKEKALIAAKDQAIAERDAALRAQKEPGIVRPREEWLWRDGIWRTERPPYRELGHRFV